jgi:hypothetical protein
VAIGAGVFLLVLAALLRFYAVPALEKLPSDEWSRQIATGTGTVLNPQTGEEINDQQIIQDQRIQGEAKQPADRPANSVVWDASTVLMFKTDTPCDTSIIAANCPLSITNETVALDNHTAEAVGGTTWSGDKISGSAGATALHHSGYIWKFPFHMGKGSFMLFDAQTGKSYPAVFEKEETIKGPGGDSIKTYKFVQTMPATFIANRTDVPPALVGEIGKVGDQVPMWYEHNTTTVWIDPISGLPIAGNQDVFISLRGFSGTDYRKVLLKGVLKLDQVQKTDDNDRPQFDASGNPVYVNYTDQAIRDAKRVDRITLIRDTVPLYGGILGLVLLVFGAFLLRPEGQARPAAHKADESRADREDTLAKDAD